MLAMLLLAVGAPLGLLDRDTPEWTWIPAILLIDVAHVYSTCFRVYFDPTELARRRWLYILVPVGSYAIAWAVYSESPTWFWRVLAYIAVFHFVRQQYGWVAMYRSRAGDFSRVGWWIDATAVYLATIYPLIYWHAHLPRQFWWFVESDFAAIPSLLAVCLAPVYWLSMALYATRSLYRGLKLGKWNPGKDLVVATTALCWYVGIITFNSDYAFTVTNVIIHGIPYMVLVFWFFRRRRTTEGSKATVWQHLFVFLGTVWFLAYAEELVWDQSLWQERPWLFGPSWGWQAGANWMVPLLAVPQLTHYILDGFIWRRRQNPELTSELKLTAGEPNASADLTESSSSGIAH